MTDIPVANPVRLVVVSPGIDRGRHIDVDRSQTIVGRGAECDIRLADQRVSRRHGVLQLLDGRVWVRDLGSSTGTFVNGMPVAAATEVRSADVVSFGPVDLRYEGGAQPMGWAADHTAQWQRPDEPWAPRQVEFNNRGDQHIGVANQIAGNQYNEQHLYQQQQSFLRDIAATKTRARWLIRLGVVLSAVGLVMFFVAFAGLGVGVKGMAGLGLFLAGLAPSQRSANSS